MSSPAPEPTTGDTPHVGAVVEVGSLTASGRRDARPQTGALEALLAPRDGDDEGTVRVVDTAEQRVRHPIDLVNLVLCAIGVAVVLLMSVYAHGTTAGVAEDVRNFSDLLARILFVPVAVLEGLITLFVPIAVLTELGVRRLGRQVVESIVAAGLGLLLGVLVVLALGAWGSDELVRGLSVYSQGAWRLTVPGYVAAIGGLLTAAGTRTRRRTVKWSWNLLFVGIGVVLITGQVSLPGILITLLLGRLAGLAVRYVSGVRSERAYGPDLVAGVRRAGFSPVALVRVRDVTDDDELAEAADDPITEVDAEGRITAEVHVGVLRAPGADDDGGTVLTADAALAAHHLGAAHPDEGAAPQGTDAAPEPQGAPSDPAAIALTRAGDNRVYAMLAEDDVRRDVVVLDGDRQVVGFLTRFWRSLRLRGSEGRAAISLRAAAERTALLSYAARAAGVRTPRLLGVAESADSMVLVQEHATGAVSLRDLPVEDLTGSVLNEAWRQLRLAHSAGIAHRALTSDVVLVSHEPATGAPEVWLTGWEQGDIASSELARRMDLAQMVALLALRVGAQRAVESAVSVLPDDDIAAIGPLLQSVALPPSTREEIRQDKELLKELRAALVERLPEADVEPQRITRFGGRTILTLVLVIAAVTALVTSFNFDQIATAVTEANPWFAVLSFALGILTWVGAALTLAAFSPKRLSMWRVTLTQAAGSYIALAAPAGIGPAALNLRLLTKRGISTPMAVATVALVQVSQFVVTILILVVLSVFTGEGGLVQLPSTTVLLAIGGVALAVLATLLVPAVRTWALAKIRPTVQQVWPRLSEMLGQPGRLALGFAGNIVMTLGYVLAFDAALAAFGQELDLVDVAVIYLVGNAAGAAVPTPGGLGAIELALIAGLTAAQVPPAIATSVAMLFRVATYWARIPIGWFAMRFLQKKGDL
ncbi:flippase-like domain-containing protein [Cellulosimicrobium cellulans]|uniref:Flippase-like domain-containing protein n=1 Tax=Cellulosimicrobium funkei TaxID=264251 RepID=A0A4Y8R3B5_9MICO|nr:flippase-like domain-containing protein [Cellulosimicrobium funkei]TFF12555.1 flippase-like domain-containing protein [Cellulosimicrobium funkei]TGA77326.1 flippase-like domain-containing protein [Cellulosimicrobium terreum]